MTDQVRLGLSLLSMVLMCIGLTPYVRHTISGKTRPHAFSWLIWAVLMVIAFAGQLTGGGGYGAWVIGFSALACFSVFILAIIYGERQITRFDWICLVSAFLAIPVWLATKTPLYSMIMVTIIDGIGFLPTLRKSYFKPHEETLITFAFGIVELGLSVVALDDINLVTAFYPVGLIIMNIGFVAFLYIRRRQLATLVSK